jgi:hypothetical protein
MNRDEFSLSQILVYYSSAMLCTFHHARQPNINLLNVYRHAYRRLMLLCDSPEGIVQRRPDVAI